MDGFLETARARLSGPVQLLRGSATAIPLGDGSVDAVVSGLVLNFVPDQRAALAEMSRVAGDGGVIAAYVWDYAGKMELMRFFWGAAVELDPGAAPAYAMALDETARTRLRARIEARIARQADGPIAMTARAWAVRGTVAR